MSLQNILQNTLYLFSIASVYECALLLENGEAFSKHPSKVNKMLVQSNNEQCLISYEHIVVLHATQLGLVG